MVLQICSERVALVSLYNLKMTSVFNIKNLISFYQLYYLPCWNVRELCLPFYQKKLLPDWSSTGTRFLLHSTIIFPINFWNVNWPLQVWQRIEPSEFVSKNKLKIIQCALGHFCVPWIKTPTSYWIAQFVLLKEQMLN